MFQPPWTRARHGDSQISACGGTMPKIELWCNIVDILLDWTDTRLPPIPLMIGWKTTNPLKWSTAWSSTRPPILGNEEFVDKIIDWKMLHVNCRCFAHIGGNDTEQNKGRLTTIVSLFCTHIQIIRQNLPADEECRENRNPSGFEYRSCVSIVQYNQHPQRQYDEVDTNYCPGHPVVYNCNGDKVN